MSVSVRSVFKKKWQILTAGFGLMPKRKPEMRTAALERESGRSNLGSSLERAGSAATCTKRICNNGCDGSADDRKAFGL